MHSAILLSLHPMLPVRVTAARYAVSAFGCRDRASPSSMPAAVMNRIEFSSPTRGGDVRCCFLSPRLQFAMHRGHRRRAFRTAVQPGVQSMEIRFGSADLRAHLLGLTICTGSDGGGVPQARRVHLPVDRYRCGWAGVVRRWLFWCCVSSA